MSASDSGTMTYRGAGVDIDRGAALVERIKPDIARTARAGVLGSIGGFGGLFELPVRQYREPVLVSGADGVGTKLMLANQLHNHRSIGIDLVAMCVNDILVCGAEPLYFLDYYATGRLQLDKSASIISGIADGCERAHCALIGGETAEMPGLYQPDEFDLAGFAVGIVEKADILDTATVQPGDAILGLASSGCHSNGYSLVRKILQHSTDNPDADWAGRPLGQQLLEPTRIYVKPVLALLKHVAVHALAHITGGGLTDNLPRSMPPDTVAVLDPQSWTPPPIFDWLQSRGSLQQHEMRRTFNCGIGMTVIVAADDTQRAIDLLQQGGETVYHIGTVAPGNGAPGVVWEPGV